MRARGEIFERPLPTLVPSMVREKAQTKRCFGPPELHNDRRQRKTIGDSTLHQRIRDY